MLTILLCCELHAEPARSRTSLSGTHLVLAPVGAASRVENSWYGAFGGELSVVRVREGRPLAAVGLSAGVTRFSSREGGMVWSSLLLGTQLSPVLGSGLSVGPIVQLDELAPPRLGAHATVWLWAGVMPYLRVGILQESGSFVDMGLAITLPTKRW